MENIKATIKSFLEKYELNNKSQTYLVAFSGGFDSMCLLDALKKVAQTNKIVALHLNHKWRGEESDNEEINCRDFCQKIGLEFYSENLSSDIPKTETAAREARYKFFEKCSEKFDSKIVFTAHNKNDNAETLIYRICTGTGITGLQGIAPHREIYYRPLLTVSRDLIETYCKNNSLCPNFDSSNSDTKYKRNYIRAKIIPEILTVNPNAIDKINSLSDIAKEETQLLDEYMAIVLSKITDGNRIKTRKFFAQSVAMQKRIIYKIFQDYGLEYDKTKILNVLEFLSENSELKSGKTCSLTSNLWVFVNCNYFEIITKKSENMPQFHILREGIFENNGYVFELEKFEKEVKKFPPSDESVAYVDLSKFSINFEIRTRQDGDYICPYGLKGSQKLKKYLNSRKIPNYQKDLLLFLTNDKEVLWAINLGISDKIKVVGRPTHRMKFYKKEQ